MSNRAKKLLRKALGNPGGLRFQEVITLASAFGFQQARKQGSHWIFKHESLAELLNLQEVHGRAKAYQVRQLLRLVEKYNLRLREEE